MKTITSINELKELEVLSPLCTKKYNPIFTSEILNEFKDYDFSVTFFRQSAHKVILSPKNKKRQIQIVMYNSYDRSLALRFYIKDTKNSIMIPFGEDRIVHMGECARNFTETIHNIKNDIENSIRTYSKIQHNLKTKATKSLKEKLSKIIFKRVLNLDPDFKNPINNLDLSIIAFINLSIRTLKDGNYYLRGKNGKLRKGRKVSSPFVELQLNTKILNTLQTNTPELFV